MNNFCTLFNHKYLSRGLALYESLIETCKDFHIYILAMDSIAYNKLIECNLLYATIVSIGELEEYCKKLKILKEERSVGEYCWTCTSVSIEYMLEKFNLPSCTYLDSDIYFYQSPEILISEMANNDTLLIEHNYSNEELKCKEKAGKYCVEFVPFKNNCNGRKILSDWKNKCLDWCYNRFEDGKFGDQKYLDEWENIPGVIVSENIGAGVAPWNVGKFEIKKLDGKMYISDNEKSNMSNEKNKFKMKPLVFYHFSGVVIFDKDVVQLDYNARRITNESIELIYKPYLKKIYCVNEKYDLNNSKFDYNCIEHFRSDDLEQLKHNHGYYRKSELIGI